jgi:hypothetical protein
MFQNMALRNIIPPKRDRVIGKWRKLQNEAICDVQSSADNSQMIKSRRVR